MIQVYEKSNTNYENNGLIIQPLSCVLDIELNGEWKLTAEVPYTEDTKTAVVPDSVIMIDTPTAKKQRYRIYETEIDDTDMTVTATASPIFLDATGAAFLVDTRPTKKNGQQALDIMTAGTVYSGESDITDIKTAYYVRKNLVEAISSDDENSFLNVWGGEIVYNNEKIIINERAGGDYGVRAEFGHNLTGLQATEDFADIVTRIVPEAYNGYTLPGDTPWVDSPLIDNYAVPHTKVIQYQDIKLAEDAQEDEEDVTICDTLQELYDALEERTEAEFEAGIDKPAVNYKCDMVELSKYEEYKDFKDLVSIWIGDTVHCSNKNVGIKVDARCIKLSYDCIREEVTSVELGNFTDKFLSDIASTMSSVAQAITPGGSVMAEQIAGIINAGKASLRAQKTVAEKQDVRAILFEDLDTSSPTYGAMCLGTAGFEIANERTADGKDWDWSTFGTANGFTADLITAGTLSAINITGSNISGSTLLSTSDDSIVLISDGIVRITTKEEAQLGIFEVANEDNNRRSYMTGGTVVCEGVDGNTTSIVPGLIMCHENISNGTYISIDPGSSDIQIVKNGSIVWAASESANYRR